MPGQPNLPRNYRLPGWRSRKHRQRQAGAARAGLVPGVLFSGSGLVLSVVCLVWEYEHSLLDLASTIQDESLGMLGSVPSRRSLGKFPIREAEGPRSTGSVQVEPARRAGTGSGNFRRGLNLHAWSA